MLIKHQFVFLIMKKEIEVFKLKKREGYLFLVILYFLTVLTMSTQAFAEETTKNIRVFYYNAKNIIDPDNPLNPEYVISVPAELNFTEEERRIDATVSMNDLKGRRYSGEKKAKVTVKSKRNYALEHTDNFQRIDYTLVKYDSKNNGTILTNTKPDVGVFDKTNTLVSGEAVLGVATIAKKNIGTYTDVLTYTVTSQ